MLAAYWAECERRVYPLAVSDPDGYMRAVEQIRFVAEALETVSDLHGLVSAWERRDSLLDGVTSPATGASTDAVTGAAFALRSQQLRAERSAAEQRARIETATSRNLEWVVLHESGDLGAGLADPYQRVELHLTSGLAVVTCAEPHPETMRPNYVVSVEAVGNAEGAVTGVNLAGYAVLETADPAQADLHRRDMRDRVAASAGDG